MYTYLHRSLTAVATFCALLMGTGCGDDNNTLATVDPEPLLLGQATVGSVAVTLYGYRSPVVGAVQLAVDLRGAATNDLVDGAEVAMTPMMHMPQDDGSTMSHSAPVEALPGPVDGLYPCVVVFLMGGAWEVDVAFEADGFTGTASFPVEVAPGSHVSAVSVGEERYFVTLIEPQQPEVGLNELEIAVYRRASMMSFPAVTDLTVDLDVSMPAMDHGSPGNVSPTHLEAGHYRGTMNATMTGDWRIDLEFGNAGGELLSTHFDIVVD